MANTKSLSTVAVGGTTALIYLTLVSDATQETNYVIYDSSAVATQLGIVDPLTCHLVSIWAVTNSAAGLIKLNWDATTPVCALPILNGAGGTLDMRFKYFGGLPNKGAAGRTGDITLTTTGLATGESLTVVLEVRAN